MVMVVAWQEGWQSCITNERVVVGWTATLKDLCTLDEVIGGRRRL